MVLSSPLPFRKPLILLLVFVLGAGSLVPAFPVSVMKREHLSTGWICNRLSEESCSGEHPAYTSARFDREQAVLIPSDPRVTSPGRVNLYRQMFLSPGELRALSFAAPSVQNPHVVPVSGSPTLFSLDECLRL